MSEYRVQVNATIGGVLFNINGDSAAEAMDNLKALAADAPTVFAHLVELKQAQLATEAFTTPDTTPDVPVVVSQGPPTGDTVSCPHGPMKDLAGQKNAKGDPYKYRYYCAAERSDPSKCKEGKVPN